MILETISGSTYMGLVAQLPCAICQLRFGVHTTDVEVHHQRSGTGGGRRASDWRTMPLCVEHHRGNTGIHGLGTKAFVREYGFSEQELVMNTWQRLGVSVLQVTSWEDAARDRRVAATAVVRAKDKVRAKAEKKQKAARPKTQWATRALKSGGKLVGGGKLQSRPFGR